MVLPAVYERSAQRFRPKAQSPQGMRMKGPGDGPPGPAFPASPPDANGATLETAIQEQLGLRLDPQRGPVPVLVIERAYQPTPD